MTTKCGQCRVLVILLTLLAGVAGCTSDSGPAPAWPNAVAQRPVVELTFDVAPDLRTLTGSESVLFTPDRPVCELVFRAWPNQPATGASMEISAATVDGTVVTPKVESAAAPAGTPGTLVELPLRTCVAAGTKLRADLSFRVTLGADADNRVGYSSSESIAWFGTAFPLLAWVGGEGWTRDPAADQYGERVTSEDFKLAALTVIAAEGQQVLGTGAAVGTSTPAPGRIAHRFTAEAVRDVAVSVGHFDVVEKRVGNTLLHVGTPSSGTEVSGERWADEIAAKLRKLTDLLGPYPYTDLWASIIPAESDGLEFPTAIQFADEQPEEIPSLVAHEVAHQWFYSLVGNNQARDPWLDESFTTFAQAVVAGQEDEYQLSDISSELVGTLGKPMEFWASRDEQYVEGVYDQGAAVLLAGREQVGAGRFDAALRDYMRRMAHRVATPADVAAAFRDLPEVTDLLRRHGALS